MELLVDQSVLCVQESLLWNKTEKVELLYSDKTYHQFVDAMYENIDGNNFLNEFIESNYGNQMSSFRMSIENTQSSNTKIMNLQEIRQKLQPMNFQDFDENNDQKIEFHEFVNKVKAKCSIDINLHIKHIDGIFENMDRNKDDYVTSIEFDKWKESLFKNSKGSINNDVWIARYDKKISKHYNFFKNKDKKKDDYELDWETTNDENFQWGVYIEKLTQRQRKQFMRNHNDTAIPNGYWHLLQDDDNNQDGDNNKHKLPPFKSIKPQIIPTTHLNLIYQLLHCIYMKSLDNDENNIDDSPLMNIMRNSHKNNGDKNNNNSSKLDITKLIDDDIIFQIEYEQYQLSWWNQKGKFDQAAVGLKHLTSVHKLRELELKNAKNAEPIELYYMRYNCDFKDVEWEWYDNDQSKYQKFPKTDKNLYCQLELSFNGNIKQNFRPSLFERRFNNCLLPTLKENLKKRGINSSDEFVFRVGFNSDDIILNMEQVAFRHQHQTHFPRNIRRLKNGKNSLYTYFNDDNLFIKRWKENYLLNSDYQQKYYWSWIIAIVCKIKYIDVEFANQAVSVSMIMDNNENVSKNANDIDLIRKWIDDKDIMKEQLDSHSFDGYLIAPLNISKNANIKDKTDIIIENRTNILKKFQDTTYINDDGQCIEKWMQTKLDWIDLQFTKQEADYLRFAECIRKYVLEYESGDTIKCLWPWYQNSFHSNTNYNDINNYHQLMQKYDFLSSWTTQSLLSFWRRQQIDFQIKLQKRDEYEIFNQTKQPLYQKKISRTTKRARRFTKSELDDDDDDVSNTNNTKSQIDLNKNKNQPPIRYKRKFAANLLLDNALVLRNLNIIRNQLKPLLNDAINKALYSVSTKDDKPSISKSYSQPSHSQQSKKSRDNNNKNAFFDMQESKSMNEFHEEYGTKEIIYKMYLDENPDTKQKLIDDFVNKQLYSDDREEWLEKGKTFWSKQIKTINTKLKNLQRETNFEHIENLTELDIDQFKLPLFEEFVRFFFVQNDKKQHEQNIGKDFDSEKLAYYRLFLESWRNIPKGWYTYDHDILLLELVLRNGVSSTKIIKDLQGPNNFQYKIRLKCKETQTTNNTFYEFKRWCSLGYNLLHRLKYLTNVIIKMLESSEMGQDDYSLLTIRIPSKNDRPKFSGISLIFSDYEATVHQSFVKSNEVPSVFDYQPPSKDEIENDDDNKEDNKHACCIACCLDCNANDDDDNDLDNDDFDDFDESKYDYDSDDINGGCCSIKRNKNRPKRRLKLNDEVITTPSFGTSIKSVSSPHRKGGYQQVVNLQTCPEDLNNTNLQTSAEIKEEIIKRNTLSMMNSEGSLGDMNTTMMSSGQLQRQTVTRIRYNDPFLQRDLDMELKETLQSFNLLDYGEPLGKFIIEQLKKQHKNAYWKILGMLMNALPYQLAIAVLRDENSIDILRHGKPSVLNDICTRLVSGSNFKPAAALAIAEFFDDLAYQDVVQEEVWREYSTNFENIAYDNVNSIESNHLLFILLNVPLSVHDQHSSLVRKALSDTRIEFLNNDRINGILHHLYRQGPLKPSDDIKVQNRTSLELFNMLLCEPMKFYFSAEGYHYCTGMLYMLYWCYVCWYSINRPIGWYSPQHNFFIYELILWVANIGYILFEIFECIEKGLIDYFDLKVGGSKNIMDASISIIWMILGAIKISFLIRDTGERINIEKDIAAQIYIFLFAIQILILTVRSLTLFSNTHYLGTLLRVVKMMTVEIVRFMYIYIIALLGFLFALWFVVISNKCADPEHEEEEECNDYAVAGIWEGLSYVFQIFVTTGDLSGIVDQPTAAVLMVFATLFGTLILTNLLIALMTTEYEKVQSKAKQEVIFNQTEVTIDLSSRGRFMPPPLNIIVFIIATVVQILNFIISTFKKEWNLYASMDYTLFENLKQHTFNFKKWKKINVKPWRYDSIKEMSDYYKTKCLNCLNKSDEIIDVKPNQILHKVCYGAILVPNQDKKNIFTIQGYTMNQLIQYIQCHKSSMDPTDQSILKQLTTNTLFCRYCYFPFLQSKVTTNDCTTTPYFAFLDLVSSITFLLIPIAYIPLIFLFGILAFYDRIMQCFDNEIDDRTYYENTDFDKEYFPEQFRNVAL